MKLYYPIFVSRNEQKSITAIVCPFLPKTFFDDKVNTLISEETLRSELREEIHEYLQQVNWREEEAAIPGEKMIDVGPLDLKNTLIIVDLEFTPKQGIFEWLLPKCGIAFFVINMILSQMDYILAAETVGTGDGNIALKVGGILCSVIIQAITYRFSNAVENLQFIGRKMDSFFCCKRNLVDTSTYTATDVFARIIMAIPALGATSAVSISVFQSIIALGKQAEAAGSTFFTPSVVQALAISTVTSSVITGGLQNISFALKLAPTMSNVLGKAKSLFFHSECCKKKIPIYIQSENESLVYGSGKSNPTELKTAV